MGGGGRSPPSLYASKDNKMRQKYSISLEDSSMVTKHKLQLSDMLSSSPYEKIDIIPTRS